MWEVLLGIPPPLIHTKPHWQSSLLSSRKPEFVRGIPPPQKKKHQFCSQFPFFHLGMCHFLDKLPLHTHTRAVIDQHSQELDWWTYELPKPNCMLLPTSALVVLVNAIMCIEPCNSF